MSPIQEIFEIDPRIKTQGLIDQFKQVADKVENDYAEAIQSAIKLGTKRKTKIEIDLQSMARDLKKATDTWMAYEEDLKDNSLQGEMRKRKMAETDMAKVKMDNLTEQWKKEKQFFDELKASQENAAKTLREQMGNAAQTFGEGMHGVFSDLTSKDIGSMAGVLGKLAAANKAAAVKAEQAGKGREGAGGSVLTGLGTFLTKMGPALMAVAALAAGLAAVVKILLDADSKGKELNRALLDAGVAGASLGKNLKETQETLDRTSKAFTEGGGAFRFNAIWGTTAKDHLAVLGAYEAAGLTMAELKKEFSGAADQQERLRKETEAALGYSKLLGLSTSEVATNFSVYMEELGMTLQGVEKRFSAILSVARESGFGIKRFFSMISQATSSMSLYNIRLQDTATLLNTLGKALGEERGGRMLQKLTEGFKGESTKEGILNVKKMGEGNAMSLARHSTDRSAREFASNVMDFFKENQKNGMAAQFTGVTGIGEGELRNIPALIKRLGTMPEDQRRAMVAAVSKISHPLGTHLETLFQQSQASTHGGLGGAVAARRYFGPQEVLLAKALSLSAVTGQRLDQLNKLSVTQRMAAEEITGMNKDEIDEVVRSLDKYVSVHERTMAESNKLKRLAPKKRADEAKDWNAKNAETLGIVLGEDGDRYKAIFDNEGRLQAATFDKENKILGDYQSTVQSLMDSESEAAKPEVDANLEEARKIAKNTADMSNLLDVGVERTLMWIYDVTKDIRDFLVPGKRSLNAAETGVQKAALDQVRKEKGDLSGTIVDRAEGRKGLVAQIATASPSDKAILKANLEVFDKETKVLETKLAKLDLEMRNIGNIQTNEDVFDATTVKGFRTSAQNTGDAGRDQKTPREQELLDTNKEIMSLTHEMNSGWSKYFGAGEKQKERMFNLQQKRRALLELTTKSANVEAPIYGKANYLAFKKVSDEAKMDATTSSLVGGGVSQDKAQGIAKFLTTGVGDSGVLKDLSSADVQRLMEHPEQLNPAAMVALKNLVPGATIGGAGGTKRVATETAPGGGGGAAGGSSGGTTNNITINGGSPRDTLFHWVNAVKAGVFGKDH